jgi:hypothetical protein
VQLDPSAHRQQPHSAYGTRGLHMPPNYLPMANTHQGTPFRQPLGNREQHTEQQTYPSQGGGYGMNGMSGMSGMSRKAAQWLHWWP